MRAVTMKSLYSLILLTQSVHPSCLNCSSKAGKLVLLQDISSQDKHGNLFLKTKLSQRSKKLQQSEHLNRNPTSIKLNYSSIIANRERNIDQNQKLK